MKRSFVRCILPVLLLAALACGGGADGPAAPTVPPLSLAVAACPALPAASAGPARPLGESLAASPAWYGGQESVLFVSPESSEGWEDLPLIPDFDAAFAQASPAAAAGDRATLCVVTPKKPIDYLDITAPGLPRARIHREGGGRYRFSAPLSPGKEGKIRISAWWNAGECEPGLDPVWLLLAGLPVPNCYQDMQETARADLGQGPASTETFDAECRFLDAAAVSARLATQQQTFAEAFAQVCAGGDLEEAQEAADGLAGLVGWADGRAAAAASALAALEKERTKAASAGVQALAAGLAAPGAWVDAWPGVMRVQVEPRTCGKSWEERFWPGPGNATCGSNLRLQNISGAPLERSGVGLYLQGRSAGFGTFPVVDGADVVTTAGERIQASFSAGPVPAEPELVPPGAAVAGDVAWVRQKNQKEAWIELKRGEEVFARLRL